MTKQYVVAADMNTSKFSVIELPNIIIDEFDSIEDAKAYANTLNYKALEQKALTVAQLIEILQGLPQDYEVMAEDEWNGSAQLENIVCAYTHIDDYRKVVILEKG